MCVCATYLQCVFFPHSPESQSLKEPSGEQKVKSEAGGERTPRGPHKKGGKFELLLTGAKSLGALSHTPPHVADSSAEAPVFFFRWSGT